MEGEKIRILLIEDNPGDARLIRELLIAEEGASLDLEHADRLSTGLARLAQGDIDVILLDLSLPDSHDLDGLGKILAQTLEVPIVVLSGLSDEAVAINAVQEGAQDYLVKGSVDSDSLVRSLHYAIERQHLRVALRESESRYRLLADNAADVIWTANMKWQITHVSPSIKRLLGYTVEEMKRLAIKDILTPDSLKQAGKLIRNQMDIMTPRSQYPSLSLTLEHVRKDGSTLWAEVMLSFLWDKDGKLSEVLGVTRDITERKKAEEALRQSEQRYRMLAENVKDVIWTRDINLRTTYVSPSVTQMSGYSVEEVMSLSIEESVTPHSLEVISSAFSKVMAEAKEQRDLSEAVVLEVELIHKNGSITPVEMKVNLLHDSDGRLTGFLGVTRDITGRKKAEEALRESQEELQAIFDSSMNGIALLDLEGRVIRVNKRVLEVGGYDTEDLSGKPLDLLKMFTPESIERMSSVRDMILSGKEGTAFECELCTKSGTKMSLEINVGPFLLKGQLFGIVAVMRDITERKKMEEALRRSEERNRELFENANDIIYTHDLTGNFTSINKAAERITGYTRQEILEINIAHVLAPEYRETARQMIEQKVKGGGETRYELAIIAKDGHEVLLEVNTRLIYEGGKPVGVQGIARDITERKRMEDALKQSEHNYRVLFESPIDGMFVVDAETMKVVLANQTVARMFRFDSVANTIGVNPLELVHPDDRERVLGFFMEDMLGENIHKVHEFRAITKDGREIWLSGIGTKIEYEGRPANLSSIRDITERKRLEEERQKMEEQLRLAGRLAAVGELAAGVAHELNNPIAAIKGFAQFLTARKDLDEAIRKDLDTIYRESQRAAKITQNLLSFARRHEPEKHPISINDVIENILEMQDHLMKVNNIELEVELDPDLPKTMADFHQMQQVFMNIVNNAEQAMLETHGKSRLLIKTQRSGKMVQITFADNGPGISEENLKRIFDPFFTTKEVGKGTGLGLSICYGLVEAHGGRIYAKSKLGQGATFVVEMPIVSKNQLVAEAALLNPGSRGVKWNKPEKQY